MKRFVKYVKGTLLFLLFILFVAGLFVFFIQDQKYSSIGSIFLSISSVLMVVITYIDSQISKKINLFSQLFNTQLALFKHYSENTAIQRTKISQNTIPLFVNCSKNFSVSPRNPITKNFCEYYKANIKECGTRELSSNEIVGIWKQFCNSLCNCSEFEYSFKNIFMCIRTVNNFTLIKDKERKHYIKTIADLMNSEQLFCYFMNQIHFYNGNCSEDKNVILLREAEFFKDLQRSKLYREIEHTIPSHIKNGLFGN